MLTSAKLPSIAFARNVSLCLSFADASAIMIAIKAAVPADKNIRFKANSYGLFGVEHAQYRRGSKFGMRPGVWGSPQLKSRSPLPWRWAIYRYGLARFV